MSYLKTPGQLISNLLKEYFLNVDDQLSLGIWKG